MRNIITLMVALGSVTAIGCGDDLDDAEMATQAQLIDASLGGSVDAGATKSDGGTDAGAALGASAIIGGKSGNTTLNGRLVFSRSGATVKATLEVEGAPPGQHGAHLHAKGDCSAADASSAGDHWNPTAGTHGAPSAASHLGDLGNLTVGADGSGKLALDNAKWTLGDGSANDVVGKAIVIHGGVDDLTTQPSGNSGPRIGCGVVEVD
jgi:superoxide dismutase, Cu-Zn family